MKTRRIIQIALVILALTTSCVKDLEKESFYETTELTGTVVMKHGGYLISGANVKVTNGKNDLASTYTDDNGHFKLEIKFDEANGYYLWVDGSSVNMPELCISLNAAAYKKSFDYNKLEVGLPTFEHNGHTYMVAPDQHYPGTNGEYISWSAANAYCNNLTAYGYSDWRMPNIDELETMYLNRNAIGGFIIYDVYSLDYSLYHSSTYSSDGNHYKVNFQNGSRTDDAESGYQSGVHVGSSFISNTQAYSHVRPIRIYN